MAERTKRTPKKRDWQSAFIAALADGMTITKACETAEVARRNAYDERERNEAFAIAWDEVIEHTTEVMEAEAYRRAVEGWIEREEFEIAEDGERIPTLTVRKYSGQLLMFLLKARRPTVYRERVEHTGAGGGPVEHRMRLDLRGLTDEQLAALEAIQPSDDVGSTDKD